MPWTGWIWLERVSAVAIVFLQEKKNTKDKSPTSVRVELDEYTVVNSRLIGRLKSIQLDSRNN